MSDKNKLLEVKKTLKRRRPSFIREGYHKKIATSKNWRQPRGNRSKVKLERRGRRKRPKVGYGSPSEVRGLTKDGFQIVIVETLDAMKKVNPKEQVALIKATVGLKKRVDMLKIAKENKVIIYNYKDAEKSIQEKLKKKEEKKEVKKQKIKEEKKEKASEVKKEKEEEALKGKKEKEALKGKEEIKDQGEDLEKKKKIEKDKVLIKARK